MWFLPNTHAQATCLRWVGGVCRLQGQGGGNWGKGGGGVRGWGGVRGGGELRGCAAPHPVMSKRGRKNV